MLAIEHPRQRKVLYGSVALVAIIAAFAAWAEPMMDFGFAPQAATQRASGWAW